MELKSDINIFFSQIQGDFFSQQHRKEKLVKVYWTIADKKRLS